MDPQITPNIFCTYTGTQSEPDATIFFISGNPGLIGYYHPFLSLLARNLVDRSQAQTGIETETTTKKTSFQIYGCSLGGFEQQAENSMHRNAKTTKDEGHPADDHLYDLEGQIRFVHRKLVDLMDGNKTSSSNSVSDISKSNSDAGSSNLSRRGKVILIGHSVGAYIAMEILRRHREGKPDIQDLLSVETRPGSGSVLSDSPSSFDIIGGVMLFPTVKDIAHSPSGQKLTNLLSFIPQLAFVVAFFARILTSLLPSSALKLVVRTVMKNPPAHALDTTVAFLKSSGGVRQALHMAADEMRTITSDKWTDDVWGVGSEAKAVARLFFYFGRNDHWVAEKTRDEVIALRGQENGLGPKMFVCEEGLPHAFCLNHSEIMAQKVGSMVWDVMQS
ncbi:hypothetical protein N7466_000898 [Penicillium verhagenii]|uniref:uncharacterized protein n=1 Tax=Penicillium verhagenii TaxID=1562060 RepID=UPI002545BCD7|nr:uncharacterized protein N7466_000898 [Penicillium verhagenii]KAJ5947883.1 hypothetical protein N7466_000898 [Penicillium verhagenii]